jgi:hypothetical protein
MAISDVYTYKSGIVTVAATTSTAAVSLYGTAAKRGWVVGIRVDIQATTAAAGNNSYFALSRPSATNTATSLTSGNAHDFSAPASICQGAVTWSTAPILVATGVLWEQELPQTTGSSWEEFPPSGYEWQVPAVANANANAGLHVFITQSVATSTTYLIDLVYSE